MKAPLSWLTEFAQLSQDMTPAALANAFTEAGLQVETMDDPSAAIKGLVVVGHVLDVVEEPQKNGKVIRWCQVDVGEHNPEGQSSRGIVCGAPNVEAGAFVPVVLPGTVLPSGFEIASRKTYGHISDGMICAEDELGLGDDHEGIIVFHRDPDPTPGEDALALLGAREVVFDIDVTPDEGHCLSIRGLAREAAQITGGVFADPYATPVPAPVSVGHPVVLDSADCALFVALTVTGVDPTATTPEWMTRRLKAAGMRSVTLPVDITNYVMLESGQPLHAYDAACVAGPIRVRKATQGESLTTLDHVKRTLSSEDLLITDDSGPIGLAGVMGGLTTEVTETTTQILLEAAWFHPVSVGRTYRRHRLASEASRRFERGVDAGVAYAAARRAAELLRDLAGAQIVDDITVAGAVPTMPSLVMDDLALPGRILGLEVAPERVISILEASGVEVTPGPGSATTLTPPTWRRDLIDPYDYVEEVGRKIGFSAIASRVPAAPVGGGYTQAQKGRRAVLNAVAAAGFVEVIPLPFICAEDLDRLEVDEADPARRLVRIANPLSEAQPFLRTTLLPGLFGCVNRNTSRSMEDLALFECGSVFRAGDETPQVMPDVSVRPTGEQIDQLFTRLPDQPRHLAGVLSGDWRVASGHGPSEPVTWRHAVHLAETAASALGVHLRRRSAEKLPWHPGRCAELGVEVDGDVVWLGWAGEVHPRVCQTWDLPARTCAVEIDLDALIALAPSNGVIHPLSKHPATKQDVALVVDESVAAADVLDALRDGAGPLLESISLFDQFAGAQIGEGKKSLAYSLVFRGEDRTLTEADATTARDAAVAEAGRRWGAVMRA
ncbi:MAG: phenylalanine--tRNA ligase subunit beta [Propionibacteriaceae bacterium]|nr:phenylalanine--tRNA ligase subunit beta [Propionibacteriaceae bacterium]